MRAPLREALWEGWMSVLVGSLGLGGRAFISVYLKEAGRRPVREWGLSAPVFAPTIPAQHCR